jgi:hypothetical protein
MLILLYLPKRQKLFYKKAGQTGITRTPTLFPLSEEIREWPPVFPGHTPFDFHSLEDFGYRWFYLAD